MVNPFNYLKRLFGIGEPNYKEIEVWEPLTSEESSTVALAREIIRGKRVPRGYEIGDEPIISLTREGRENLEALSKYPSGRIKKVRIRV